MAEFSRYCLRLRAEGSEHNTKRAKELPASPDKTELVLFVKRKKVAGLVEANLFNRVLHPTCSIKYLVMILKAKLSWREHVKQRITKAYSFCRLCYRSLGKT
jgi:hypothetical protein